MVLADGEAQCRPPPTDTVGGRGSGSRPVRPFARRRRRCLPTRAEHRRRCARSNRRRPVSRSVEIVAAAPTAIPSADTIVQAGLSSAPAQFAPASRYRVYNREAERVLPVGIAPERGLQVRTILAARSISAMFPEIQSIGGVRPDGLRWHPERSGARRDDPQPEQRGGHSARKPDRLVRTREREAIRIAGRDLAWRLLHAPSGAQPAGTATMTTSTSPRPVADSPAAMRSTPAEPATRGRR